jgi:hypothetical protein
MQTNSKVIAIVISALAVMAVMCVSTICVLSYLSIEVGPELNTLAGGLVGALTAMLVKTSPTESVRQITPTGVLSGSTPVTVVNEETNPVPTTTEETK